jgi:hypothetical protein
MERNKNKEKDKKRWKKKIERNGQTQRGTKKNSKSR